MTKHPTQQNLAERLAWSKLSQVLTFMRHPEVCQSCGDTQPGEGVAKPDLTRWVECDEWERSTGVVVVLCRPCVTRVLEPHPRLYREIETYAPHPGTMALCVACTHRFGLNCKHPDLRANGGAGLLITHAKAVRALVNVGGGRGHRRGCLPVSIYAHPPTACAGRVEVDRTT
jgi:hypothetical protein